MEGTHLATQASQDLGAPAKSRSTKGKLIVPQSLIYISYK